MCANKKATRNVPANIQKKKLATKKAMKKKANPPTVPAIPVTPITTEPIDYDEEIDQDPGQFLLQINHGGCRVMVGVKWSNG